ncbi:MAG: ABC transporter ATP-binding protein [Eggerthellaceae bacterium]|nr:ABC transporter ATP-binding protein [Eggerthellaceae bacterium]
MAWRFGHTEEAVARQANLRDAAADARERSVETMARQSDLSGSAVGTPGYSGVNARANAPVCSVAVAPAATPECLATAAPTRPSTPLLDVRGFGVAFCEGHDETFVVDDVDLTVDTGEIVGVVGESGCGKSVMAQSLVRLLEHENRMAYCGQVLFEGDDLLRRPLSRMREVRGSKIAMIFQDPLTSLNPVATVGAQLVETMRLHGKLSRAEAREQAAELLARVGIDKPTERLANFPSDLSGGMQQRVMIAIALACKPKLLIADEPTTALDTTTQKQILDLLGELNAQTGMAVMLISHDLEVVASVCSKIEVMYLGQVVEQAPTSELFARPLHPYTRGLLSSTPPLRGELPSVLSSIPGGVPSAHGVIAGCRFANRCGTAVESCVCAPAPQLAEAANGHLVRCPFAVGEVALS